MSQDLHFCVLAKLSFMFPSTQNYRFLRNTSECCTTISLPLELYKTLQSEVSPAEFPGLVTFRVTLMSFSQDGE